MSSPSRRIASMTSGSTARRSASHEPDRQSAYRSLVEGAIGVQPSARRAAERGLRTRGTEADSGSMRRLALVACAAVALVAGVGDAGAVTSANSPSWAAPQIKTVVAAGLMAPSVGDFRPDDPITSSELAVVLASLGSPVTVASNPDRPITMRELDARL